MAVTGPVELDVSVDSGQVRMKRGEDGAVLIRGWIRARQSLFSFGDARRRAVEMAAHPPVWQEENHIKIGDLDDPGLLRNVELTLEILAPAETRVRAFGDSADLSVEGMNGAVYCEADSGGIHIDDAGADASASCDSGSIEISKVKGAVIAHCDSGSIRISRVGAGVRATCDSGSIAILEATGPVEAETDSGSIQAAKIGGAVSVRADSGSLDVSQTAAAPVRAHTDSGNISLRLAESGGYTLRLRTEDGNIQTPDGRGTRGEMECQVRGGGAVVYLETESGNIDVL